MTTRISRFIVYVAGFSICLGSYALLVHFRGNRGSNHLLIGEPRVAKLSRAMQVLKQRISLRCRAKKRKKANQMKLWDEAAAPAFWQPRYYDFNVFTRRK